MFLICCFVYGTVLIALSLSLSLFFVLQKILEYFPFVQIVFPNFFDKSQSNTSEIFW